jgi:hypothetical protein
VQANKGYTKEQFFVALFIIFFPKTHGDWQEIDFFLIFPNLKVRFCGFNFNQAAWKAINFSRQKKKKYSRTLICWPSLLESFRIMHLTIECSIY